MTKGGKGFTQSKLFVMVLVNGMHNHYFRRLTKGGFGFTEKNVHVHNHYFRRLTKRVFWFTHGKLVVNGEWRGLNRWKIDSKSMNSMNLLVFAFNQELHCEG